MKKRIMLLFLSEVHVTRDGTLPDEITYRIDGEAPVRGAMSNEPALRYVQRLLRKKNAQLDAVYLFATARVRAPICPDSAVAAMRQSHAAYFIERATNGDGELAGRFRPVPYDENDDAVSAGKRNFRAVSQMVRCLQEEARTDEVELYVDMTGGFRHASMLMLAVMRLLEYERIGVEKVLYANYNSRGDSRLEEVTEFYQLFDLIAGMESFMQFADTRTLCKYFENKSASPALQELLQVMRRFSDAVRICRAGQFVPLLRQLAASIESFRMRGAGGDDNHEAVFQRVLTTIERQYGAILHAHGDADAYHLDIIRWCCDKGLLQQAMTLYTEWIPAYIVRRKIFYPSQERCEIIQKICETRKKAYQSWEQYYLNEYKDKGAPAEVLVSFLQPLKTAMRCIAEGKPARRLLTLLGVGTENVLAQFEKIAELQKSTALFRLKQQAPLVYELVIEDYIQWQQTSPKGKEISPLTYFQRQAPEALLRRWAKRDDVCLRAAMLKAGETALANASSAKESIPKDKWPQRKRELETLLRSGVAATQAPEAKAFLLLEDLHWVRSNRNEANHASAKDSLQESEALSARLGQCLTRLREFG